MEWKGQELVNMKKSIHVDVRHCARCKMDHEQLDFRILLYPIEDNDGTIWEWWSLCPETGEPILLRAIEDSK